MKLHACSCEAGYYRRVQRTWWMRPVWTRRLYVCLGCDCRLLLPRAEVLARRLLERTRNGALALRSRTPRG